MGYPHPDVKKRRLKRLQREQLDTLNNSPNIPNMDSKIDRNLNSTNNTVDERKQSDTKQEESKSLCDVDKCNESYDIAKSRSKDASKLKNRGIAENTMNSKDEKRHYKMTNSSPHCDSKNRHNEEEKSLRYLIFVIDRKTMYSHKNDLSVTIAY